MKRIQLTPRRTEQSTKLVTPAVSSRRSVPSEFLREMQSAASMIMSREECAALERELAALNYPRAVSAA